mmetsp:Transcript_84250/g.176308  ORF Transcript_84250/g.176308 Transcript_84250/m.176308 type:complete len:778 (-) Transcript_84250:316-2649(-)|eukprot:CAMPEP_0206443844 /NCGR_PEP_ID=MMETSP0324_2-20121206/14590_1 /ASSEMBLY_ACC=CAM_ASM_000836 /TAXON_ID=2866 /ORGANISM="Crypthecodinium cohnii, Strain Seligo" /LENGTH=777 /DNA_ID=CAMNT_0053911817 /DNA_START=269 /DNA_END=2602 /DNA_ORIENTATION=+
MPIPFMSGEGFQRRTILASASSVGKSIDTDLSSVSSSSCQESNHSSDTWNDFDGAGISTGTIANRPTRVAHVLTEVRKVRAIRISAVTTVMLFQVSSLCCLLIPRAVVFEGFIAQNGWDDLREAEAIVHNWQKVCIGGIAWATGSVIIAFVFIFTLWSRKKLSSTSPVALSMEVYIFLTWAVMIGYSLEMNFFWLLSVHASRVCRLFVRGLDILSLYYFYSIIEQRIRLIEAGWPTRLGSGWFLGFRRAWLAGMVFQTTSATYGCLPCFGGSFLRCLRPFDKGWYWSVVNTGEGTLAVGCGFLFIGAISTVRKPTAIASKVLTGYAKAEQKWARDYLGFVRVAMGLPVLAAGFGYFAKAIAFNFDDGFQISLLLDAIVRMNGALMELLSLVFMVGIFRGQRPAIQADEDQEQPLTNVRRQQSLPKTPAWTQKVEELSKRGMTVQQLLDFYKMLGDEVMVHFDPRRSTTNDIVRQAVIPLSCEAGGGVAFCDSQHVRGGRHGHPRTMVTHAWDNVFSHLVAAVVADALGKKDYEGVVEMLVNRHFDSLSRQLEIRQISNESYWICAFCVNQHSAICNSFGQPPDDPKDFARWDRSRRDSVSDEAYPTCDCTTTKYLNGTPELCEINKFDDMMAHLSKVVPDLRQLVAVDQKFILFSRAWCVAELVEASMSEIPQNVEIYSNRPFRANDAEALHIYAKLAKLTVQDCKASRKEDKDAILARIPDIPRFDAKLLEIIFGTYGLLSQKFVGFGLLDAAVRTARRSLEVVRSNTDNKNGTTE